MDIKEWIENNRAADYFFMPNTLLAFWASSDFMKALIMI